MPIHRLLDNTAFQPAEVETMAQAFETSGHLKQEDRNAGIQLVSVWRT
jgi:hypothetical protein